MLQKHLKTDFLSAFINPLRETAPAIFTPSAEMCPNDLLYVIDMQNDFIGHCKSSPQKGRFNVEEGDQIIRPIANLIKKAGQNGTKIVASRDYHPNGHVSFSSAGGPFPDHCVMGSYGSSFATDIKKALLDQKEHVSVVFKGCYENIDSFGALPYEKNHALSGRISIKENLPAALSFTGGFEILEHDNPIFHPILSTRRWLLEDSICENPVEAQFKKAINNCEIQGEFEAKSACVLRPKNIDSDVKNVFFVGLAADFCVLDSAINAKMANPKLDVHIIYDLTRYAWLSPEQKSYGRGPDFASGRFITDISEIANKYRELDIKLVHSTDLKILKV